MIRRRKNEITSRLFRKPLENMTELRAGSAGRLELCSDYLDLEADALTAPSRTWGSATPYEVTRHTKKVGAAEALITDLRAECRRNGLPEPADVDVMAARGVPRIGLAGRARLVFKVAVHRPLLLGRSRHLGGGLSVGAGAHVAEQQHAADATSRHR